MLYFFLSLEILALPTLCPFKFVHSISMFIYSIKQLGNVEKNERTRKKNKLFRTKKKLHE